MAPKESKNCEQRNVFVVINAEKDYQIKYTNPVTLSRDRNDREQIDNINQLLQLDHQLSKLMIRRFSVHFLLFYFFNNYSKTATFTNKARVCQNDHGLQRI